MAECMGAVAVDIRAHRPGIADDCASNRSVATKDKRERRRRARPGGHSANHYATDGQLRIALCGLVGVIHHDREVGGRSLWPVCNFDRDCTSLLRPLRPGEQPYSRTLGEQIRRCLGIAMMQPCPVRELYLANPIVCQFRRNSVLVCHRLLGIHQHQVCNATASVRCRPTCPRFGRAVPERSGLACRHGVWQRCRQFDRIEARFRHTSGVLVSSFLAVDCHVRDIVINQSTSNFNS